MKPFSSNLGLLSLTQSLAGACLMGALLACSPQKVTKATKVHTFPEETETENASLPFLKYSFTPKAMGEYEIHISSDNFSGFQNLQLEKQSASDGHWFTVQISNSSIDYIESSLKTSTRVNYRLKTFIQDQVTLLSSLTLQVPIDWILETPTHWVPTENLRRIFLKKTTLWISTTENTKPIELPEIQSEQGEIHIKNTSREKHSVSLKISLLKGSIRIGAIGTEGAPGEDGNAGKPGEMGAQGEAGMAVLKNEPFLGIKNVGICIRKPTDGKEGKKGGNGEDGKKGGNGGPTPKVTLYTSKLESSRLSFFVEPGAGGKGGKAGSGGLAGLGGPAGIQDHLKICPPAKQGPHGKEGNPGKNGEEGKTGKVYPIEWATP